MHRDNYIIYNNSIHYNRLINIIYPLEHKKHSKNNTIKKEILISYLKSNW